MTTKLSSRRYDLDWLKALAVLLVPIAHAIIIFTNTPYLIKNPETSVVMDIVIVTIALPIMPLFFTISGMSIHYALRSKSTRQFLRSRVLRLLIPFFFGLFTISSVSTYYAQRSRGAFRGTFLDFYPHYFDGFWGYGGNFPWYGHHLYFLLYLFVFTLLGLPVFLYLIRQKNHPLVARLARFSTNPGALYLLVVPVMMIEASNPFAAHGLPHQGGWHMLSYPFFMLAGFLFASSDEFQTAIDRHARFTPFVAIGAALSAMLIYSIAGQTLAVMIPAAVYAWCIDIAVLSAARLHLNKPSRALSTLGDIALPLYILHEGILVPVAFHVTATELGILPKLIIILAVALPWMLILTLLVRRANGTRFLFGLPPLAQGK